MTLMTLSQVTVLLLGATLIRSQVIFTECPGDWILFQDKCYRFVGYPQLLPDNAVQICQKDGGTLISIDGEEEHNFVLNWLNEFDGGRGNWLTSGVVSIQPPGIQWLGSGEFSTLNYWLPLVTEDEKEDGSLVVYSYSASFGWSVGDPSALTNYICEIALKDSYKITEEKRGFDYGLPIDSPWLAPRGPSFDDEPVDTMILSDTSAAYLDCQADGSPKPKYKWLRDRGNRMVDIETGPGTRYTLTSGRLTIDYPQDDDEGIYQCNATNEFGTILSSPISLSFGDIGQFSNVATADVEGQLSDGAAITCPRINVKPAARYTWYKKKYETSEPVVLRPEMQQHIFVSNSGKLYFSELASSDDDIYFCSATLTSFGDTGVYIGSNELESRISVDFRLIVRTGVSSDYRPVIQDDFIKVYPNNPKRGQTIQMECFAYGTRPLDYRWYRHGKEMPRNASLSSSRRVLTITNVQIEDSGQYMCRVDGRKTHQSDEKNYTLTVQSEPYFSYPLMDQHADIGSRLTWHCEARGIPPPTYRWLKDGQPLTRSPGVTLNNNVMVIDTLDRDRDTGMYQCVATNIHGSTFSSAQIRVLQFMPTFAKHPVDLSLSAAVGGNITIVCNPEAAPAPTYTWLRNGADLGLTQGGSGSNGFRMLLNGNLFIENINNGHEGTYTCSVSNSEGEAQSSGVLQVFPAITLSQQPKPVKELVNETATILCTASAAPNLDVVYVWKFNNHIIDFEEKVEYKLGGGQNMGNLFIIGVQYKHEGFYTCQATTGMDFAAGTAYLTVNGPPGEPTGVIYGDNMGLDYTQVNPDERFVRLYWTDGKKHGGTIRAYTVEFRTDFNQKWRVHPAADRIESRFVQSSEYPTKRTLLLKDLKPNAQHEFRVRAISEYGVGAPSLPSALRIILGTAPLVPPSGISGGGGKVGDLTITWQPLPREDHNGPDLKYIVYWRAKPASQAEDTRWQQKELKPEEACRSVPDIKRGLIVLCSHVALVGRDNYFRPYETRLRAHNVYGDGVLSGIVSIMSAEEMPTATPTQVFSVSYNATALEVHWTPVGNTRLEMKGRLIGYRINYWHRDTEEEDQARFNIIRVPEGENNIDTGLVIGLEPGEWYIVNVQAISLAGYGPKSEDYPQETTNQAPALYPTEVHVYSIDGVGVRVTFRGISTMVAEEPLMGYKMQYWPSMENIRNAWNVDVGRANYGYITNLTESVLYQLRIFGYSRGGQGKRSSPSVYFTVGDGQLRYDPERAEVMAGSWILQSSLITMVMSLLLSVLIVQPLYH